MATDSAGAILVLPVKFKFSSYGAGYRYRKFAKQMQEENPHLELTREIVDKAAEDVIRKQRSAHYEHASATKLLREVSPLETDNTPNSFPELICSGCRCRIRRVLGYKGRGKVVEQQRQETVRPFSGSNLAHFSRALGSSPFLGLSIPALCSSQRRNILSIPMSSASPSSSPLCHIVQFPFRVFP